MSKELKAFTVTISLGNPNGELTDKKVCLKDEVDALLAENDKDIESLKASHYAEMVDAGMRERRLRRALWLARAERAKAMYTYWHVKCIEGHLLYEHKWIVVERLCRAKAEEEK